MRCWAACLLTVLLPAATVDRLAITVGATVITQLQIDEDLRVAALLSSQPMTRDPEARRTAADRLVEQLLIEHEIALSRYPPPSDQEITALLTHIQQTMGGADRLRNLLLQFSLSEETLRAHLRAQLVTLRFIEFRFRPDINITDNEIEAQYQQELAALKKANATAQLPPLDAAEKGKLAEMLTQERTDAALDSWLAESRKQVNIVYLDSSLQ